MAKRQIPYKVMACFDIETNNDIKHNTAYAVTYQLSVLTSHLIPCSAITNNVVKDLLDITIDRDYKDICKRFDDLILYGKDNFIVPVIMVHNLSFEMWVLSVYLKKHVVDGCSKSTSKPLTIVIHDEDTNDPVLVFWDTLSFWGKSLDKLGDECKYPKLTGCWDYNKQRTNETPLTDEEIAYAIEDVVVPWAYMGYYLRLNPEIDEKDLACKILTKTSAVRYKSKKRCGNFRVNGKTTSFMWLKQNRQQKPTTNEELETTHGSTRGGFTYCAANTAGKPFFKNDGYHIYMYDANSMHICHALSHLVPIDYKVCTPKKLLYSFNKVISVTPEELIENYENPFRCNKFYAKFRFTNIRLKPGTIFERDGISTLTQGRFKQYREEQKLIDDNEGGIAFKEYLMANGYSDTASDDAKFAFGKFFSASECYLFLNELSAWEVGQQFIWDSVECVQGYLSTKSNYATDKSVLSFNNFYQAKTNFKRLKGKYEHNEPITDDMAGFGVPEYLFKAMQAHDPNVQQDVEAYYLFVKSDLNSLYGIEATNEAKNEIILTDEGYKVGEYKGIDALPRSPKAWYQYGTHIVGWSRIHQLLFMYLTRNVVDHFICGDTDSHKIYTKATPEVIEELLQPLHDACDRACYFCTRRARRLVEWFPMDGLGWYECEGECEAFAAGWNKSYVRLENGKIDITMAGIPCNHKFKLADGSIVNHSYNTAANYWYNHGKSFAELASILIGYNVYIAYNITGLNNRHVPKWGAIHEETKQPCAVLIYPMHKVIGCTDNSDNAVNMSYTTRNYPMVNTKPIIIDWPLNSEKPMIINIM